MKRMLRPLILALVLAGGFYFYTTQHPASLKSPFSEPTKLELTQASGPETLDPGRAGQRQRLQEGDSIGGEHSLARREL